MTERRKPEISIPIGPLHPSLIEPLRVKLETLGERVKEAEYDGGFAHKDIERIMEGKSWEKCIYLSSRIGGICSGVHNMTFVETLEEIASVKVPKRGRYLRVILNELDRIQSHLFANILLFLSIEHETLAMWLLDAREPIMDTIEEITGHRIILDWCMPGGVKRDAPDGLLEDLPHRLDEFLEKIDRYGEFLESGPISIRTKGIGQLSRRDARRAPATGPVARASGIDRDLRSDHTTYRDLDFDTVYGSDGDIHARAVQRFEEITQSAGIIKNAVEKMNPGPVKAEVDIAGGEGKVKNEAPRGKLSYMVKTDSEGKIDNIEIRTPTELNLKAFIDHMAEGTPTVPDAVATYVSIDPCIACMER